MTARPQLVKYRVIGMDCANDAAEIEKSVRGLPGGEAARVSVAAHILILPHAEPSGLDRIGAALAELGYRLERLEQAPGADAAHLRPAYRRALWIVVGLNLGYGVIEAAGGFLAGSQALKADALDFAGDGLITLLGLLAMRWLARKRARIALLQGVFLGLLGLGVVANTAYRALVHQLPSYEAMGVLAAIALLANLASAAVLLPHRTGDANVRAVWLFSRNDAIGNLLVLAAAALVAVTDTPWPDLAVGALVALLFLHSSWSIIGSARDDLREATT